MRSSRWERATDTPLLALGIAFLIAYATPIIAPEISPGWHLFLEWIEIGSWAAFTVDFVVRVSLAEDQRAFIRTHILDLLPVALVRHRQPRGRGGHQGRARRQRGQTRDPHRRDRRAQGPRRAPGRPATPGSADRGLTRRPAPASPDRDSGRPFQMSKSVLGGAASVSVAVFVAVLDTERAASVSRMLFRALCRRVWLTGSAV